MFIIGIDPHRGSHTAAVLDDTEEVIDELPGAWLIAVNAIGCSSGRRCSPRGCGRSRARPGPVRCWPSSSSPSASASSMCRRSCRRGCGCWTRGAATRPTATTPAPPRWSRCVTSRCARCSAEDHVAVLRLLAKRHHDLTAARTRAVCRLHTTLCHLAEGHFPKRMTASQGAAILARIRPDGPGVDRTQSPGPRPARRGPPR